MHQIGIRDEGFSIVRISSKDGFVVYLEKKNYLDFVDNIDYSVYYEYENKDKLKGLVQ